MTWFDQLFGRTSTFGLRVALREDPEPEPTGEAGLWGTIELWVAGRCLTRSRRPDDSVADGVTWYVDRAMEWFSSVAVQLTNQEPFPLTPSRDNLGNAVDWYRASGTTPVTSNEESDWFTLRSEWYSAHAFRNAFPGAVAPSVFFRRLGHGLEVSWDNDNWPSPRPDVEFLDVRGTRSISCVDAGSVIIEMLDSVAAGATSRGQRCCWQRPSTVPADAWKWLIPPLTADCIESASSLRHLLHRLEGLAANSRWPIVEHTVDTLLLRNIASNDAALVKDIVSVFADAAGATGSPELFERLRNPSPAPDRTPWDRGYEEALRVREILDWGGRPAPNLSTWLGSEGFQLFDTKLADFIDGASWVSSEGAVSLHHNPLARNLSAWSQQMLLATGLGLALLDAPRHRPFAMVQAPWAHWPSIARARAFGAMLLMPEDAVSELVADVGQIGAKTVEAVMSQFGTGVEATTWHMKNLGWLSDDQRVELRASLLANRWNREERGVEA